MADMQTHVTARPGFRGLDLKPGYDSGDRLLETFYVPVLSRAVKYDRSVGYFRSSSLAAAAKGISRFINSGGVIRLLCGAEITPADRNALLNKDVLDEAFARRLAASLVTDDEVARRRLEVLAWLAKEKRLEIRIAIPVDASGQPLTTSNGETYFHEKIGVLRDARGDGIAFQGSVNESATAWARNFESFSVYASWNATATHFSYWANKFEDRWEGKVPGFKVYNLPEAARLQLISLAPDQMPDEVDPEEPPAVGDDAVVARYLLEAPRLIGAERLAEATTGVKLFPHQRQVVARLADTYPRSWLVADEVGLGKTISAGMSLRRLLLDGRVRKVLILAPANVCRQWQDELFEKFGLWIPRLDGNKIYGAHPSEVRKLPSGANPYAEHPVLIASSHLARRVEHHELVLAAGPYDLVILDEAHHARRTHFNDEDYRPGRLLQLLDKITQSGAAKAIWLLTATPMQLHPVELRDLLLHAGLDGAMANEHVFLEYFRQLAREGNEPNWDWLNRTLQSTPRPPAGPAEKAVLDRIRRQVGVVEAAHIERFGTDGASAAEITSNLSPAGHDALRLWLRTLSPVGQFVTRHSRETLKAYYARGLLRQKPPDRDVRPVIIDFLPEEQELYDQLDEWIDRLMEAHGKRRGAGLVLTVYRRRLTSSWAAIRKTLMRRLNREELTLDDDFLEEAEGELDTGLGGTVDDSQAVPLTEEELSELRAYVEAMRNVPDSKFEQLRRDLDAARSAGHSTIVFTQFTDTLDDLRDRLFHSYRSQLATFTGDGGRIFREHEGWVEIAKRDLVDAIRSGRVTLLLATDAASEGLNLQACSYLINYDMPWNPMRVEQRIGRIDRLGQVRDVVHIRNYFIEGTVEELVYSALASRITTFTTLLGNLQPILGETERTFQTIFRAPRHERQATQELALSRLMESIDSVEKNGIDLTLEDPMPVPDYPPSPVTLKDLQDVLVDRFGSILDEPGRPVTWDPSRASRDPDGWTALATYGHPRVRDELARHVVKSLPDNSALVIVGEPDGPAVAVRADRSPPELIRSLADVDDLGVAHARGDAERLARDLLSREVNARKARADQMRRTQRRQATASFRRRFVDLIRSTIAAGCAASRYEGGAGKDPMSVWFELTYDRTSPFAYAEAFRRKLQVPLVELTSTDLATMLKPIPDEQWRVIRATRGLDLANLMREFNENGQSPA